MARRIGRERRVKRALRRHRVQHIARFQIRIGPSAERAARDPLYAHAQRAIIQPRTDRIGASHFLPAEIAPKGQVLALNELERACILWPQGHNHAVACVTGDLCHGQGVETAHAWALRYI